MKFRQQKILVLLTFLFFVSNLSAQKIAFSRDGSTLAVNWTIDVAGGDDYSQFLFYDVKAGKLKSSLINENLPNYLIFSNDSKNVIFGERLILEKIGFDQTGKPTLSDNPLSTENFLIDDKFQNEINAEFLGFALSSDGKTLYRLFPNFLNAYSFPELKFQPEKSRSIKLVETAKGHNHFIGFSRDGSVIIESEYAGNDSAMVIKETGKQSAKIPLTKIKDDEEFPEVFAFVSENKETLLLKSSLDYGLISRLEFWDLKKRTSLGSFSSELLSESSTKEFFPINSAGISPDGKKAAVTFNAFDEDSAAIRAVTVYDIASKKSVDITVKAENYLRFAESFVFSSDSKQLATLSTVLTPGKVAAKVHIWDAQTGKLIKEFE